MPQYTEMVLMQCTMGLLYHDTFHNLQVNIVEQKMSELVVASSSGEDAIALQAQQQQQK